MREERLRTDDHSRDSAGLTHVYPVLSRRAGGLSVGINLNPNRACNWRCVYCQVPGLVRGSAPEIDGKLLERELRGLLTEVRQGDLLERRLPPEARRLVDVAFSGDGEPTTARGLADIVRRVGRVLAEHGLAGSLPVRLITNGSRMLEPPVQEALEVLAGLGGEVWFKLDRATREGRARINDVRGDPERVLEQLAACASRCPTWLQTCMFRFDGEDPPEEELVAWLELVERALAQGVRLEGVLLYGLARPSLQPEAPRLERLPLEWLDAFAERIRARTGLAVRVSE